MLTDKELKKELLKKTSKNPEKFYPMSYLKKQGFSRNSCTKCGRFFWSTLNTNVCGDGSCSGGFRFIGDSPAKEPLDYIEVWKRFARMFKSFGYTPINRYPVAARWNPTVDFTIASIAAFQPFVVSGEVEPPANPLVIPQFCLRFGDTDNVGVTGSHMTGFVMIGQHQFVSPKEWNQEKVFEHIHSWLKEGLGLPDDEIIFHEEVWAGGGNFGPSMEFFSRGVELGNQVYMLYEQTADGQKDLPIKVLDMGMGEERVTWFTQGAATIYDATFPTVMKRLYKIADVTPDPKFMKEFVPLAGSLNVDESEDMEKSWNAVAQKLGFTSLALKEKVLPLAGLYSIAEHARSLLVALNDGALPSNVGGGYNLRLLARRAFSFIDQYNWKISLPEVCAWHAEYLKPLFPELSENLEEVKKILDVEKNKYDATKEKSRALVAKTVSETLDNEKLIELYDSYGVQPELIREEAAKLGRIVKVPDNFYALVASRHDKKEQEHETKKEVQQIDVKGIPETKIRYYEDYVITHFKAKVLKIIEDKVILDQTYFYPTSGGQLHDIGFLNKIQIVDIYRQGQYMIHVLEKKDHGLRVGSEVEGEIDKERRIQLAQHHTSTHIVNAAARKVLGMHANQAGAKKTPEKAHIDITHYQSLSEDQLEQIEKEANEIISSKIPVHSSFMSRTDAEKRFGMGIYQGGVPIGKDLRIVNIENTDVECCGGTHLKNTGEAHKIKILKATKISDSIIRIEFVAGKAADAHEKRDQNVIEILSELLKCKPEQLPGRAKELFEKWKTVVKKGKKVESLNLTSTEAYDGEDIVEKVAEIYKTQPEFVIRTTERFLKELKEKN